MAQREVIMLGTSAQAPTVERSQTACLLRWDDTGIMFDPGEGAQRQLAGSGVSPSAIDHICITHFHGDHCLGLPGLLMRLTLDGAHRAIPVHYPVGGEVNLQHLLLASAGQEQDDLVEPHPITCEGVIVRGAEYTLSCAPLSHTVDTVGYRLEEPDGRTLLPSRLADVGLEGADIGRLRKEGSIRHGDLTVSIEDVSVERRGQVFAFVMDTGWCDGALRLAAGADLLVCESTFLSTESDLAEQYGHLTAQQAGRLAQEAGVRRLVLSHFSRRYPEPERFGEEAGGEFGGDIVVAHDFERIAVPSRR